MILRYIFDDDEHLWIAIFADKKHLIAKENTCEVTVSMRMRLKFQFGIVVYFLLYPFLFISFSDSF